MRDHAALLLGETEGIIKILDGRDVPTLDPSQAAYIDEWRIAIEPENVST